MSRRHSATKRKINPDAKYGNLKIAKFMNYTMLDGKKSVAERIVYSALDILAKNLKGDAVELFGEITSKIEPHVEVRSRRVGGATYQVPVEVRPDRAQSLAFRWLINAARSRKEKHMEERLAYELIDAYNGRGNAFKKREDTHKMADANKAFSHFKL